MPYVMITTLIRLENGPTVVGDEASDRDLMAYLGASLVQKTGNPFKEWVVDLPPRVVLNKLEDAGYKVVGTAGIGQTAIWTLHKPKE
ncbi:GTP cyclohydrolase 1 feedback regulatory protein-like [Clavelina lepadiformis]|uniref:GTP cyclohydrolase 1 feedback regulatory protein-like n=1 Tax=Clavelina lepadiformis TaxID=159417 RepID=UPI0040432EE5